jgi:hypothetical protein
MNPLMMRKQNGEGILSITFLNYYLSYGLSFQNFFEPMVWRSKVMKFFVISLLVAVAWPHIVINLHAQVLLYFSM